jgi:hypothetical protein
VELEGTLVLPVFVLAGELLLVGNIEDVDAEVGLIVAAVEAVVGVVVALAVEVEVVVVVALEA